MRPPALLLPIATSLALGLPAWAEPPDEDGSAAPVVGAEPTGEDDEGPDPGEPPEPDDDDATPAPPPADDGAPTPPPPGTKPPASAAPNAPAGAPAAAEPAPKGPAAPRPRRPGLSVMAGEVDQDEPEESVMVAGATTHVADLSLPPFTPLLVLDPGRLGPAKPTETTLSFSMHGELQLRFRANNDLPLQPRIGTPAGVDSTLGQNYYLYEWLRLRPLFQFRDKLRVVGEVDLPRGMVVGETTQLVSAAREDLSQLKWYGFVPRQLFLEYSSPIGMFRVGHQTSHWAMGLLANDGDHPSLFGDYRGGSISERVLFATKPMGKEGPLALAVAGDLIYQDGRAQLVGDLPPSKTPAEELRPAGDSSPSTDDLKGKDRALQAVAAVRWQAEHFELGVYGVFRHQERDCRSVGALTPFTEVLQVGVVDLAGRFDAPVPGTRAHVFGEAEASFIGGYTSYVRNIDQLRSGEDEAIQSWGGAATVGVAHVAGPARHSWGDLVVAVEYGYATGDADPYDGVTRRFTFDQNHNVGLVLFDHVMAWQTARAATIAQDPMVTYRPSPGLELLPSEGAIFGATYVNPTVVVRPQRWLDLKGGVVIAQTTADYVDPFHAGALGSYANFDGGDEKRHDLGVELDLGVDGRIAVASEIVFQLGAEGGVLFPGAALEDGAGKRMPKQFLLNTKLGVQF